MIKAQLRNQVAALFLMLPIAAALSVLPTVAIAQPAEAELRSLEVSSDGGLSAGTELQFTVEGAPRAIVRVRIDGVKRNIVLRETSRGVYTGAYTVTRQDRISEDSPIRATLRLRNRTVMANYSFPAGISRPPVAAAPPSALKIDRFFMAPIDKIEPGSELRFTLNGMPGGVAEFDIPGIADNVRMRETHPGVYEGAYTLRRQDKLTPSRPIVATLRVGDRSVTSAMTAATPPTADAKPPVIRNMAPRDGEAVIDGRAVAVSGTFDDAGGVGVDPATVRIMLGGRNITSDSQITPQFFTYRADLPLGRYAVEVTARDRAGNAVRQAWSFDVVSPVSAAPVAVPLQITSHGNNAVIEGGSTTVRGRTSPGALVDVKVVGIPPLVGLFGMSQNVLQQRVQADASGNFSFTFAPQLPLPGTRYEITMESNKGNMKAESTLVLFQKQG
ncbi:hypothetical protein [Polaromonas sp.]|jgi:hypothetical protein|uniref:hypothetical protein n=1 Tax=Polaromonas sp. TaxID=1869339 RepID=UPI0025FFBC27|nr:hypothetical protein [Polaromonas sp.]